VISHEIQSYDNTHGEHFTYEDDTIINMADYRENPEDTAHYRQLVRNFLDYLEKRDKDARDVADLILNGDIIQSSELAVQLGKSVKDIDNTRKRLRRYARIYLKENDLEDMQKQLCLVDED